MDIPKYILKTSETNGLDFYHYLHIKGGSGNWQNRSEEYLYGGEYDYCLFYADASQMEGCDICERIWCVEHNIIYGLGSSIEEAYGNYLKKVEINGTSFLDS